MCSGKKKNSGKIKRNDIKPRTSAIEMHFLKIHFLKKCSKTIKNNK
jgi:hypothetical protein